MNRIIGKILTLSILLFSGFSQAAEEATSPGKITELQLGRVYFGMQMAHDISGVNPANCAIADGRVWYSRRYYINAVDQMVETAREAFRHDWNVELTISGSVCIFNRPAFVKMRIFK